MDIDFDATAEHTRQSIREHLIERETCKAWFVWWASTHMLHVHGVRASKSTIASVPDNARLILDWATLLDYLCDQLEVRLR